MKHNMQKLQELAVRNGPLCVGLDTDPSYIPECVRKNYDSPAEAVLAYNKEIISRVASGQSACCFKVQIAYYEAMGLAGMAAYAQTLPFTEYAEKNGKGLFVLLRTSNPGMTDIEQQELKDGSFVLDRVGGELDRLASEFASVYEGQTCSPVGAVVGCTEEQNARMLREAHPDVFFLIPGYGAQGGAARIAATLLLKAGGTVNSSRGILCAWKKSPTCLEKEQAGTLTMDDLGDAAGAAALAAKNDLEQALRELA